MCKKLAEMTMEELWVLFPIILEQHNLDWQKWYEEEKKSLLYILGETKYCLNHIGSTAVKGLLAKPTVDILLEIHLESDKLKIKDKLIKNGWVLMAQSETPFFRMSFNKGYTEKGFAEKVFHLHIVNSGQHDELYFRDYLRENKDVADEYAKLKLKLQENFKHDRDAYTNAKTDFIIKYTNIAKEVYSDKYKL